MNSDKQVFLFERVFPRSNTKGYLHSSIDSVLELWATSIPGIVVYYYCADLKRNKGTVLAKYYKVP